VIESVQMCALLASVEKIVHIIDRGQVYELVYKDGISKQSLEHLQSALVELYSASLELLANSAKLFAQNTAVRTLYAIFHPGETGGLVSRLVELETKLRDEALLCESERSSAADARLTNLLRGLDAPLTRIDEGVAALLEYVSDSKRMEILDWVSTIPHGKHHNRVKEKRTADTCDWLLRHERFREWEGSSSSILLWLQGSRKCADS
jgi:hypothetical protein